MGATALSAVENDVGLSATETVSLRGQWWFRIDAGNAGTGQRWYGADESLDDWEKVDLPHTWQVQPPWTDYRGLAWYRRSFDVPASWLNAAVRIEFEAVFHTATVWVNGRLAGEHARKGYTAFGLHMRHQ